MSCSDSVLVLPVRPTLCQAEIIFTIFKLNGTVKKMSDFDVQKRKSKGKQVNDKLKCSESSPPVTWPWPTSFTTCRSPFPFTTTRPTPSCGWWPWPVQNESNTVD